MMIILKIIIIDTTDLIHIYLMQNTKHRNDRQSVNTHTSVHEYEGVRLLWKQKVHEDREIMENMWDITSDLIETERCGNQWRGMSR
jgi:hypothetical protein